MVELKEFPMIYPENFDRKIGFNDIRTQLKGRCISVLGTEWVDRQLQFSASYEEIRERLDRVVEFARFMQEAEDAYEEQFHDARQALLKARPERTYMEELDLFDLKRSLKTILDLVNYFCNGANAGKEETEAEKETDESEQKVAYPALYRLSKDVHTFPEIIKRIDDTLNKYGRVKDTASSELLTIRHSLEVTMRGISHSLRSIIAEAQSEGYIDRDVSPTLRDGRLVIPVAPALKRKIKGIIHDESATGKTVFIEPTAVVEANNKIRELKAAEKREIIQTTHSFLLPLYGLKNELQEKK